MKCPIMQCMRVFPFVFTMAFAAMTIHFGSTLSAADDVDHVQDGSRYDQELNERDFDALKRYLNTKRAVELEEKDENLSISGDVRFEWRHMTESLRGLSLRGPHRKDPFTNVPVSRNDFDCEFNLKFDYTMDRSWAIAHIQYDNSAGVDSQDLPCSCDPNGWFGSGRSDNLCLRKAYMGYNFWMNPSSRLDIELGRRGNLYHVFDSRVQFLSRFDGFLLKWSGKLEGKEEWFWKLGGLVCDERVNHFAYITELGWLNIMCSGFDLKYSFIDWNPHVRSRCLRKLDSCCPKYIFRHSHDPDAYDFAISQFTIAYHLCPDWFHRPAKLFGAFLINHNQKYVVLKHGSDKHKELCDVSCDKDKNKKKGKRKYPANIAWYVGFSCGEVVKEGDWAIELQYQVVQALAVPGQDMSGIGDGNVFDYTLTSPWHVDNTNFRGWKAEGLYALTDNITVDTIIEQSWADNPNIGGPHNYSKVEVEAIYAF